MSGRHVDVGGHRLFVREQGSGPPILLGHSLTFDHEMWAAQQDALAGRYRTLAFDHRGHGASDPVDGPFDLWAMADDVVRLLDALQLDRVAYCGLSLGGMVGMRLALAHPDRVQALVLMNTSAEPEPPGRRDLYAQLNDQNRGAEPNEATVSFLLSLMFSAAFLEAEPEWREWAHRKLFVPNDEGLYWVSRAVILREDILSMLADISAPTLVVTGDADQAVDPVHAQRIAAAVPGARLETLSGCGHMSAVERPAEVGDRLAAFFAAHLPEATA